MTWPIKQHDLEPPFRTRLMVRRPGGVLVPVDLAGKTIRFLMRNASTNELKVDAFAHAMTPEECHEAGISADKDGSYLGWVEYAWASGNTDTSGLYKAEFETIEGGRRRTFPQRDHLYILVVPDLGP